MAKQRHQAICYRKLIGDHLDYLVIDMPPGTERYSSHAYANGSCYRCCNCNHAAGCCAADERYCYVCSSADKYSHHWFGRKYGILHAAELPNNKYYIFGKKAASGFQREYELPFLGRFLWCKVFAKVVMQVFPQ